MGWGYSGPGVQPRTPVTRTDVASDGGAAKSVLAIRGASPERVTPSTGTLAGLTIGFCLVSLSLSALAGLATS